uniref:Lipocalin/cytosolic fatty-acid binding domain-containing protein n=1 Tax=Graphocephala atropunctata TaxID=36148 RepID=A0A1B6M4R9_9HEMI
MKFVTIVSVILSLNVIDEINTMNICKCDIITNFYKIHPQHKYALSTINALGVLTYYSVTKEDIPPGVKCVTCFVNTSSNKSAEGHTIFNYYNTSISPKHQYLKMRDVGRGYVVERDASNNTYRIYFINVPGIACYYRCVEDEIKGGSDLAAIAVPIHTQDQPEVLEAVAECKMKLKALGIAETLVDVITCRPPE